MDSLSSDRIVRNAINKIDDELSTRFIELDPTGYFLIRIDTDSNELVAEHFSNDIDEHGRAIDPETGEILACRGGEPRKPKKIYRGQTAKQLGIQLTEGEGPFPLSRLDHALYLGRELQKAEFCLINRKSYIQD